MALGKPVFQVNTYRNDPAGLAVDGIRNQSSRSCTDAWDTGPWWAVDLGQVMFIRAVNVTNDGQLSE